MRNRPRGMTIQRRKLFFSALLVLAVLCGGARAVEGPALLGGGSGGGGAVSSSGLLGEGIDFRGGMLDWEEDENGHRVAILRNYAVVLLPNLTISARNMVLNVELQEIYAEGDVLFDEQGGNAFYCDQLTFNYQEWQGLAKNIRVKMDREDVDLPVRDFLDERPSTGMSTSVSINDAAVGRSQLKRMYVQAAELRAHDADTFELIDAKITPSSFAKPHWYFKSPAALFRQREKIESYHNTVNIGNVPFLYFPYLIRDLQYDWPWMRISAGFTGDYGYFARTQWGWRMADRPDAYFRTDKIVFDLDFFSRRGVGVGAETTYQMGHFESLGKLKAYGVWEFLQSEGRDYDRAHDRNEDRIYDTVAGWRPSYYRDDFRWAVDWEHYQQLNEYWDVRAQAHLYHDRDYLKEYDPTRYWNAQEPTNSINVRRMDRQWELEFVASSRLSNKWMNQPEYLPEARLTVPGMQLGTGPLYFKNDMRVGVVNRRFDEDEYKYTHWSTGVGRGGLFEYDPVTGHSVSRLYDKDSYGSFLRAFNEMRLEAPIPVANILTVKPWIGLRTAFYSKTQGGDYNWADVNREFSLGHIDYGDPEVEYPRAGVYHPSLRYRQGKREYDYAIPFGVELSTRMYTFFGASEQWRLITEPVVSWTENTKPRLDYDRDLYPIDSFDVYRRERKYGFELHTKLQRRYFEDSSGQTVPERDILDFNLALEQYPRQEDRRDDNSNNHRYSALELDLKYRPTDRLTLAGSVEYDLNDDAANRAIGQVDYRFNNYLRAFVTHYHFRGDSGYARYRSPSASSQTHLALRTKLWNDSSRYSLEGAVAYEWKSTDATWRTERDGTRHGFNKYRLTLFRDLDTFEMALSYVRDRNADDHGVFFSLSPKAFMGYERPPPGYSMEVEELGNGRYGAASARFLEDGYAIDAPARDADIRDVQF